MALAQPPGPPINPSTGGSDPLTVLGPAVACGDNVVLRNDTTTPNTLQCSAVTIADTTGAITGATSIIGGTGAADTLTLDGSVATAGSATVSAAGAIRAGDGSASAASFSVASHAGTGMYYDAESSALGFSYAGVFRMNLRDTNGLSLDPTLPFSWGSSGGATTLNLYRDDTSILALRRTSANLSNTFRVYGTADAYPSFTNYARLSLASTDGASTITTETAGTAADDQNLVLKGEGPTAILTLDGSDEVAGAVTVSAAGAMTVAGNLQSDTRLLLNIATYPIGFITTSGTRLLSVSASDGVLSIPAYDGAFQVNAVEANTAGVGSPNILVSTEQGKTLTNEGATALNYHTLPTAAAGLQFTFIVQDTDGLRITAAAGDTIRLFQQESAVAGYINNSGEKGAAITLVAINATEWVATTIIGNWTFDGA